MNSFLKSLFTLTLMASFAIVQAQQGFYSRNAAESFRKHVRTESNTSVKADSITIQNGEAGIIQVKVIGLHVDGADPVTGTLQYSYSKSGGVLTLGTAVIIDTIRTDTDIPGATFAAVVVNNNVRINVTGSSGKPIRWTVITKQQFRRN